MTTAKRTESPQKGKARRTDKERAQAELARAQRDEKAAYERRAKAKERLDNATAELADARRRAQYAAQHWALNPGEEITDGEPSPS